MPVLDSTGWKLITAFAAIAGFMVSVMVYRTNEMDNRLREVEIEQAKLWCAVNTETCMGDRNATR